VYRLKAIDDKLIVPELNPQSRPERGVLVLNGPYLMNYGLNLRLEGDFDSTS
jgi:hypothetical protein